MANSYRPFVVANEALNDPQQLREVLREHGYLFLRGVAPREKVLDLRKEILEICRDAGWIDPSSDLMAGTWSGAGPFTEGQPQYMAVYQQVLHNPSFLAFPEDQQLIKIMRDVIDGPVLAHRLRIGRITFPQNVEQTTAPHQDFHYIHGAAATYTLWTPVGDCPIALGGLSVLNGSHRGGMIEHALDKTKKYAGHGVPEHKEPKGDDIAWHAGDFKAGDVVIFHSHTVHKAMPNLTPKTLRLSVDNRYQRVGDDIHEISTKSHYEL